MAEAVLLNSGGIDSRVAAAIMSGEDYGWRLHSLYLPINPHNLRATSAAAKRTADLYCVDHHVAKEFDGWVVRQCGDRMGTPFTGAFCAMLGALYADCLGVQWVVSGSRSDAMAGDWRPHMVEILSMSRISKAPALVMPLREHRDVEAGLRLAKDLHVDISDTHSCWSDEPCGECGKCAARSGAVGGDWSRLPRNRERGQADSGPDSGPPFRTLDA